MSVAVIMLVHTELGRAAQAARAWAEGGCPVVIHVDRCIDDAALAGLRAQLADLPDIRFAPRRRRCNWGTWQIVAATQEAAAQALSAFPGADHVFLASGACLPLRPPGALAAYLAAHRDTDFIESVSVDDVVWAKGGLERERFELAFPFGWKSHRRLFDLLVALQRRLGVRRRVPGGLAPHLGAQWWCLTRATLSAILNDPDRAAFDRYFARVWIPDESYFQTLARRHARQIESRSLTFARFDSHGQPHIFFDDHRDLLAASGAFVARKIWPGADGLYAHFPRKGTADAPPTPHEVGPEVGPEAGLAGALDGLIERAHERRRFGRAGLLGQSRFPRPWAEARPTAAPYWVFQGFDALFTDFAPWLAAQTGARVHGHLFAPDRAHFAGGALVGPGGLSASAALRDRDPDAFLRNLVWAERGQRLCFLHGPADTGAILPVLAQDPNARIAAISGAWAVALFRRGGECAQLRREAARLQRLEGAQLAQLRSPGTRAQVTTWPLASFIKAPMTHLHRLLDEIAPPDPRRLRPAPVMSDLAGFGAFVHELRNLGIPPHLVGALADDLPAALPNPALPNPAPPTPALPAAR